jgi:hypothetical protein
MYIYIDMHRYKYIYTCIQTSIYTFEGEEGLQESLRGVFRRDGIGLGCTRSLIGPIPPS